MKKISDVYIKKDYLILIIYVDGEKRMFDVGELLQYPMFKSLLDYTIFKTIKVSIDKITIEWENGVDLSPEDLYENSIVINK